MRLQWLRREDRAEPYLMVLRHKKASNSLRRSLLSWLRGLYPYDSALSYWPTSLLNNEWLRGPAATFTELP